MALCGAASMEADQPTSSASGDYEARLLGSLGEADGLGLKYF